MNGEEDPQELRHNFFVVGMGILLVGGMLLVINHFYGASEVALSGNNLVAIAKDYDALVRPEVMEDLSGTWQESANSEKRIAFSHSGVLEREEGSLRIVGTYEVLSRRAAGDALGVEDEVSDIIFLEKMTGSEKHYLVNFRGENEPSLTPIPDGTPVRYQRISE